MLAWIGLQPLARGKGGRLRSHRHEGEKAGADGNSPKDRASAHASIAVTFFVKKRGKTYRVEGRHGERLRRGTGERGRLRLSLGTMNGDAAHLLYSKIERALAEGPGSALWRELKTLLPPAAFAKLSGLCGYVTEGPRPTWQELSAKFSAWLL